MQEEYNDAVLQNTTVLQLNAFKLLYLISILQYI